MEQHTLEQIEEKRERDSVDKELIGRELSNQLGSIVDIEENDK